MHPEGKAVHRALFLLTLTALAAGCGMRLSPAGAPESRQRRDLPRSPAPALSFPSGAHQASTAYGSWEIVDSANADFTDDELTLMPPPGGWAWAIADLGEYASDDRISFVDFPSAPSWGGTPPTHAWVALANYSRGAWEFRYCEGAAGPVDFSGLLEGTDVTSPTDSHAYIAVISDVEAPFGTVGIAPVVSLFDPALAVDCGQYNRLQFTAAGVGDIATYCPGPAENGGAIVRGTISGSTIGWTIYPLYESGKALQNCSRFDVAHFPDNRLASVAASSEPTRLIRYVTEDAVGAGTPAATFSWETAVDSDYLPDPFPAPQVAFTLAGTAPDIYPQVVYLGLGSTLKYSFSVGFAWVHVAGGYGQAGGHCDVIARAGGDLVVSFLDMLPSSTALSVGSYSPVGTPGGAWGPSYQVCLVPPQDAGYYSSLAEGLSGRLHVAHCLKAATGISHSLAYARTDDGGVLAAPWTTQVVDQGGPERDVGEYASLGVLSNGHPVIAYYDAGNKQLWLALGTSVDGGVNGGEPGEGWIRFAVDTGTGTDGVGRYASLDVLHGTPLGSDTIGIAYEAVLSGASTLRLALVR
jgi:hypothetical protein